MCFHRKELITVQYSTMQDKTVHYSTVETNEQRAGGGYSTVQNQASYAHTIAILRLFQGLRKGSGPLSLSLYLSPLALRASRKVLLERDRTQRGAPLAETAACGALGSSVGIGAFGPCGHWGLRSVQAWGDRPWSSWARTGRRFPCPRAFDAWPSPCRPAWRPLAPESPASSRAPTWVRWSALSIQRTSPRSLYEDGGLTFGQAGAARFSRGLSPRRQLRLGAARGGRMM